MTYVASSRNRLTLCIVIRAVGDEDIMIMGWLLPKILSVKFLARDIGNVRALRASILGSGDIG